MEKKRFEFETVIKDKINFCNLKAEKEKVIGLIFDGKKVLLYGRRNTGKTSLVETFVIPEWKKRYKDGLYIQIDLYGVRSINHISQRIAIGFSEGFSRTFKTKSIIQSVIKQIASLKPRMTLDNNGKPQIELSISEDQVPHFKEVLKNINEIHLKKIPVLLIMDEFQDIGGIEEAEGLLRDSLQRLGPTIPVIILGSKKHLLSKIFSVPQAPLYNWGETVEIPEIDYDEYTVFIADRGIAIDKDVSQYLQDRMKRIPEPVNIVCYHLLKKNVAKKKITQKIVDEVIDEIVHDRRSRPQEYLSTLTDSQARFIKVLSMHGAIKKLTAKAIQRETKITGPGILKIVSFFEDNGIVYHGENGYEISDPFLELHLIKYGI